MVAPSVPISSRCWRRTGCCRRWCRQRGNRRALVSPSSASSGGGARSKPPPLPHAGVSQPSPTPSLGCLFRQSSARSCGGSGRNGRLWRRGRLVRPGLGGGDTGGVITGMGKGPGSWRSAEGELCGGWETLCLPLLPCQEPATGAQRLSGCTELIPGWGVGAPPPLPLPQGWGAPGPPPSPSPRRCSTSRPPTSPSAGYGRAPRSPHLAVGAPPVSQRGGGSAVGEAPRSPPPSLSDAPWLRCVPPRSSCLAPPVPLPAILGPHRDRGWGGCFFFPPRRKSGRLRRRGGAMAWPRCSAASVGPPGSSRSCGASGSWCWPWHSVSGPTAGPGG